MQSRISYTKETIEKNISEGSFSLRKKDDLPAQEGFWVFFPYIVNFRHNMGHAHSNDNSIYGILPEI